MGNSLTCVIRSTRALRRTVDTTGLRGGQSSPIKQKILVKRELSRILGVNF